MGNCDLIKLASKFCRTISSEGYCESKEKATDVIDEMRTTLELNENEAGEFLHSLGQDKPDIPNVRKIIAMYPESLLYENKLGEVPIQSALKSCSSITYIPLLVEEAFIRGMLGTSRGGLFLPLKSRPSCNILQWLVYSWTRAGTISHEDYCLQALKDLRCMKLLRDEDFTEFNLLEYAICYTTTIKRLGYLLDINPTLISAPSANGNLPIHRTCRNHRGNISLFDMVLKVSMTYHPKEFGFLFRKNAGGERAISLAITKFGKDSTLQIIQRRIPPASNHPILHQIYRHIPELVDDFILRYPDAIFLKDGQNRLLLHVAAKRGVKLSSFLLMLVHSDKQSLEVKDPVTNLYPFMLAAVAKENELTTIYKLLTCCLETFLSCIISP